jgi:hypothetical protein
VPDGQRAATSELQLRGGRLRVDVEGAAGIPCVLLKGRAFSDLHPEPRHADHWHEGP